MEVLVSKMETGLYTFNYKSDAEGRVTHISFTHLHSVEMLNQYPEVLLLDCTYKTNYFKMPLLNIVNSTCRHKTYHISFCFLFDETEESYIWALIQLSHLFTASRASDVMIMD